jgi:hypothetical protein
MNLKRFGRNKSRTTVQNLLGGTEEYHEKFRITGVQAEN